jgi:ankyrin repeat protein
MIKNNKAYLFIGPKTTIETNILLNKNLKVYGNGKDAINCKDYKLPEYSRVIVMAHGVNLFEFLKTQGIDTNVHKPAIENHIIKLCRDNKPYDITHKVINNISGSKPMNIELFSCYGGLATKDINQLASDSTITTFIPANSQSTRHIEYFYLQKSFMNTYTYNPFIHFAHNLFLNTNELQFALNIEGIAKIFASKISDMTSLYNELSNDNIRTWQLNELKKFQEFCNIIEASASAEITKQINDFNDFILEHLLDLETLDIAQYKEALLISSADEQNINLVTDLINNGVDINSKLIGSGASALFAAASRGHENIVQFLLENSNINPNIQDDIGLTPLYISAQNNQTEAVKLLLAHQDINPNIDSSRGTALDIAVDLEHSSIVKMILAAGGFTHEHNWHSSESKAIQNQIKLFKKDPVKYIFKHNDNPTYISHALNELKKFNNFIDFSLKISKAIDCLNQSNLNNDYDIVKTCGDLPQHNEL